MILVVGATGSLGGQIARGLLERGHAVRALVRTGSAYAPLVEAGAEPTIGDLKDASSLAGACRGVETVVATALSLGRRPEDTIEAVDIAGYRGLIQAAAAADVQRFIFMSALGAAPDSSVPLMAAKGATETVLRASGMEWTILAPNAFMDVWLAAVVAGPALSGREVVYVGSGTRRHAFVHSRDVAAFTLSVVDSPAAANRYLPIGGPAAISIRDAVAVFERVIGRPVAHRGVASGEPVPGLPPFMAEMLATFDTFDSPMDMTGLAAEFGVSLTSVEAWAEGLVPVGAA